MEKLQVSMISEYIKLEDNTKIGIMVAITDDRVGSFAIGWSVCNVEKDKFNKKIAMQMAIDRAKLALRGRDIFYFPPEKGQKARPKYPSHIKNNLINFFDRASLYFKDKKYVAEYAI